ncbi:scyllo-inositol 2-dehydrogenase (NAD(+)) [Paenibacillus cisolokensis]|uniref:Scyllo-inositol 2-dehydrogenase (NAD(+)) n=1 Tax=Paenibacillus cisolokensis TaxID=1658519 RepID=A0ABQ4N1Q9_9BACL|nr:Gfo/Idh/MocA family oxidoreductase [Paenibacillus cisolokensis]GIQ62077.1 scyllo-inositol 2-dehydrogenase (NAD(+)) [Paenibacillus cisolokensis]
MNKIGIAVIGAGRMGRLHAWNFYRYVADCKVAAVCDANAQAAKALAGELGAKAYADTAELLQSEEVDAVVITTPVLTHKAIAVQALEAGKHVFCEKPLTLQLEDAQEIVRKVEETGKVFQLGFMRRFDRGYEAAWQKVREGAIGTPVFIRSTSRDPGLPPVPGWGCYPEKSGDISFELCSHDYDSIRWLMNDEVDTVFAQAAVLSSQKELRLCGGQMMNDTIAATLRFKRGALGTVEGLLNIKYGYDARTEIIGDEGVISIGQMNYIDIATATSDRQIKLPAAPSFTDRFAEAYVKEARHFVDCIRSGSAPLVGACDGLKAVKIAHAANLSVQQGMPVQVNGAMA